MPAFNGRVQPETILLMPAEAFYSFILAFLIFVMSQALALHAPFFLLLIMWTGSVSLIMYGIYIISIRDQLLIRKSIKVSEHENTLSCRWGKIKE